MTYQQKLRKYEDIKSALIRNGMSGDNLANALRQLADRLQI